jgi:hypothetical protein
MAVIRVQEVVIALMVIMVHRVVRNAQKTVILRPATRKLENAGMMAARKASMVATVSFPACLLACADAIELPAIAMRVI